VRQAIQALKDVVGSDNVEDIKAKTEALGQVAMKFGESMYKATQAAGEGAPHDPGAGGPGAGPHGGPHAGHDDKVVDADFEEVDEKKRGQG
jgi:molecular chaperone DnaK